MKNNKVLNGIRGWWCYEILGLNYRKRGFSRVFLAVIYSIIVYISVAITLFIVVTKFFACLNLDILTDEEGSINIRLILSMSLVLLVSFIISLYLTKIIFERFAPKRIIRDKKYILSLFENRSDSSPVPTRKKLIEKIYGEAKNVEDKDSYELILKSINENVEPIKAFLESPGKERIMCLNGGWGSGKTTALLIAINETKQEKNRYIYEAALKYLGNTKELINDILGTLEDSLRELGVKIDSSVDLLIRNFDTKPDKMFMNFLKNRRSLATLSSELILRLNSEYKKAKCNKTIYITIDDLDRLMGEDIIDVISFLSVLKNLNFVRIIIPADLNVVYAALDNYKVVDPPKFVAKYLPYSNCVNIQSECDMVERVLSSKLMYAQEKEQKPDFGVYPSIASIFIGMLAELMLNETRNMKNYRYRWLKSKNQELPTEPMSENLSQLLRAPVIMSKNFDNSYGWFDYNNSIKKFQNIVCALNKKHGVRETPIPLNRLFDDSVYNLIDNWIFPYMETRWNIFGFTVRDALNMLGKVKYNNLPVEPAEQFVYVFNQLFPNDRLEMNNERIN